MPLGKSRVFAKSLPCCYVEKGYSVPLNVRANVEAESSEGSNVQRLKQGRPSDGAAAAGVCTTKVKEGVASVKVRASENTT